MVPRLNTLKNSPLFQSSCLTNYVEAEKGPISFLYLLIPSLLLFLSLLLLSLTEVSGTNNSEGSVGWGGIFWVVF
jgi:hypothetical protein